MGNYMPELTLDERRLAMRRQQYGDLSYEGVILLIEQAESYLKTLPVHDPAYEKFAVDRFRMYQFAYNYQRAHPELIAHCDPITALYEVSGVCKEEVFYVSRHFRFERDKVAEVRSQILTKYTHIHPMDLEIAI